MRLQEKGVGDTGGSHHDGGTSRGTLPPKVALVPGDVIKKFSHTKRVGTYLLGKTLGEGSFAKVKEGLHTLTGEKVAVKVIDKKKAREDVYVRKNLRREGKLLQMVRHRHVVRLFEIMETENSYYLVTELCHGGDLMEHICTRKRLDEKETRKYIRQILSAVDYLHKLGILHRDLKVENLLLDENKNIKIIDFGLSNSVEVTNNPGGSTVFHEFCVTQCGSPAYAAPELLGNSKYGPNVDIWSIGVNMFAMLTGSLPFTVEPFNIKALHKKMLKGDMNPTPEHLTKNCRDLLKRFLNPDPDARITIREAMKHPWICEVYIKGVEEAPFPNRLTPDELTPEIIHHMTHQLEFRPQDAVRLVTGNIPNSATATYFLLSQRLARHDAEVAMHARIHRAVKNASRPLPQEQNNYEITGTDVIELLPISDREDSQPHKKSSSTNVHTQEPKVLEMTMSPRRLPREEERPVRGGTRSRPARQEEADRSPGRGGGGGRLPLGPPGPPSRDPSPRRHHPPPLTRRPSADQSPRHSPRPSPRRRGSNITNNSHNNNHNNNHNNTSHNNNSHAPRRGSLEPPRLGNLLPRSQSQETEGSSVAPSDVVLPDLEPEAEEGQMIHLPNEGQKSCERQGGQSRAGGRSRGGAPSKDMMNLPAVTHLNRRPSFELPVSPEPHSRLAPPDKGRGMVDRHSYNNNSGSGGMRPDPDRLSPATAPYRTMSAHSADRKFNNGSSNTSIGRQSALGGGGGGGGGGRPTTMHRGEEQGLVGRPTTGMEWRSARPTTRSAYPHTETTRVSDSGAIPRKLVIDVGQYDRFARATGRIRTIASGDTEPVYVGGHRRLINLMYPAQQHNRKPGHAALTTPSQRSPQLLRAATASHPQHAQHGPDHNQLGVSGERAAGTGSANTNMAGGGGGVNSSGGGGGGRGGGGMAPTTGGGLNRDTIPHTHLSSRHVEVVSQHLLETSRDLRGASSPVGGNSRTPSPSYRRSPTAPGGGGGGGGARVGLPAISPTPGSHNASTRMQVEDLDK